MATGAGAVPVRKMAGEDPPCCSGKITALPCGNRMVRKPLPKPKTPRRKGGRG